MIRNRKAILHTVTVRITPQQVEAFLHGRAIPDTTADLLRVLNHPSFAGASGLYRLVRRRDYSFTIHREVPRP